MTAIIDSASGSTEESVYEARPIKRRRRTKGQMEALREAIYDVCEENRPATVRQVYYQLVSRGFIEKTESQYKRVCKVSGDMRKDGELPYLWIADGTRWVRQPDTYSSMEDMLNYHAKHYRRALWMEADVSVEIWLEKEALAGVLVEVTDEFDVPLYVTKGYGSLSYLYTAAQQILAHGKPTYIYNFGDHDPSGVDILRDIENKLRFHAPDAEIYFERIAVTPSQIAEWELLTRPTKKTDSRAKNFEGESVEVDAIPPPTLRELVRRCIYLHVDDDRLAAELRTQELERETLKALRLPGEEGAEE